MSIEDKLMFLTKNIQDIILLVENNKVIFATDSYKKLFNSNIDDISDFKEYLYKHTHPEYINIVENYKYEDEFNHKLKIKTEKEIERWILMKSTPYVDEKQNSYTIINLSDITNIVEKEVYESQSRIDFVSNLTHELKTPLNLIFSSIQLLNRQVGSNNNFTQDYLRKYLDIVSQNSYRMLKLVNNICEEAKINSDHDTYNPANENIVEFIENICNSIVTLINSNNMNIVFDTDIEELIVSFDIEKMEKIILNLLSNSIKFRKEKDGEIIVKISYDEEFVNIIVKDNGIGIQKENLDNVFGRYTRLNDEKSLVTEGVGIGLSLVSYFVKLHSGTIEVDSCYGDWTEFIVKIPNKTIEAKNSIINDLERIEEDRIERIKVEFSDIYKSLKQVNS